LPKFPDDTHSSGNTFYQLPRLAKKDMKFITSNLLDVGTDVADGKPRVKRSKKMAAELKQVGQRLKKRSSKRPAELRLLDRVKQEHADYY
jgi:hypothetical protein